MPTQELVQQVKDLQRISKGHSQAWDRFVKEAGGSKLDPGTKDDDFLQKFVDAMEMGMISTEYEDQWDAPSSGKGKGKKGGAVGGDGPAPELVERVKEWQRMSKGHKMAWDRYVKEIGGDKSLDPRAKDSGFLKQFLDATEQGLISTDYDEDEWNARSSGKGKGKDGTKGGAGKLSGTDQYSAGASTKWNPADGDRDAMLGYLATGMAVMIEKGKGKFGKGFVKLVEMKGVGKGLIDLRESSGGKGYGSANARDDQAAELVRRKSEKVQRVKEWQRISKGHKLAWDRYCEEKGSTKLDPQAKDNDFLQTFLDATEQGLINTDFDEDEWNARNPPKGKDGTKGGAAKGYRNADAWNPNDGDRPEKGKGKASDFRGGFGKGARSSPY